MRGNSNKECRNKQTNKQIRASGLQTKECKEKRKTKGRVPATKARKSLKAFNSQAQKHSPIKNLQKNYYTFSIY